jgi:hypothetical protein
MNASSKRTVGFVGLGVMGEPMCANLARRSKTAVLAWDVRADPLARVADSGAVAASSLEDLASHCDLVFVCLADGQATESVAKVVLDHWQRTPGPGVLVDMGTTSVAFTRRMAQVFEAAGHRWVDAPVARMLQAAADGSLSIMVGAAPEVTELLRPWLECMGSDIVVCGAAGNGQVVKILHNVVLFEAVHSLAEALALARRNGVPGEVLLDAITLGSADSLAARVQARTALLPRQYPKGKFSTRYALKDARLALELAELAGMSARVARLTESMLRDAADAGFVDHYYPALYELLDPLLAVPVPLPFAEKTS